MVHELFQMPLKVWLYSSLKSTMLILDNQVSIKIQNNFKCKKQTIIKVNLDIVTCNAALPCMLWGEGKRKGIAVFLCFHSVEGRRGAWGREHILGHRKKS